MKKEDIKIGSQYYYNNSQVIILRFESDTFVLVEAVTSIQTEINGSNFCYACMTMAPEHTHTCESAQEIIDSVIDELSEKNIFWVKIDHIQEKPIEYKKWEKIMEQNKLLEGQLILRRQMIHDLNNKIETEFARLQTIMSRQKELNNEIVNEQNEKEKTQANNYNNYTIISQNIEIPQKNMIQFIIDSLKMRCLESRGIDNWDGYYDCFPKNEELETKAFETLLKFKKDK